MIPEPRGGEISNFRHMLGLDNIGHGHSAPVHNNVNAGNLGPKPRTMKDSKEIMKKRRERAICIVSIYQRILL